MSNLKNIMNKSVIFSLVLVVAVVFGADTASAQFYPDNLYNNTYQPYSTVQTPGTACISISNYLARGSNDFSTGGEVSELQRFLVSQNYPGGGDWMITGYFGSGTEQAVKNFQSASGIVQTGTVGPSTRSAISRATCGLGLLTPPAPIVPENTSTLPFGSTLPFSNFFSTTFPYVADYFQSFTQLVNPGVIQISQLSPTAGSVGTQVNIHGFGFSEDGNAVHFGNGVIANLRSFDGKSLSFEVPMELKGFGTRPIELAAYNVSVVNKYGARSNSLPFEVTSLTKDTLSPTVLNISGPTNVSVGVPATWTVTWRASAGRYITTKIGWGDGTNPTTQTVQSTFLNQQSQSFSHVYSSAGTYTINFEVRNSSGKTNTKTLVVSVGGGTGGGSGSGNTTLSSISPSQGQAGVQIVIQGTGFTSADNTVHFGIGGTRNLVSTDGGTKVFYTIPHFISPCDLIVGTCSASATQVTPGTYPIFVSSSLGSTGANNFTVIQ